MAGLPREKDTTRPRDAWATMVCGGVESLTYALRRGDAFTEKALQDMLALSRRLNAFNDALNARLTERTDNETP